MRRKLVSLSGKRKKIKSSTSRNYLYIPTFTNIIRVYLSFHYLKFNQVVGNGGLLMQFWRNEMNVIFSRVGAQIKRVLTVFLLV